MSPGTLCQVLWCCTAPGFNSFPLVPLPHPSIYPLGKLGKRFSRLAKWISAQLLEIYRQLEKFSSFLLFILSHANGAPDRDFPLFSAAVELWGNH